MKLTSDYLLTAEGSVMIEAGHTMVLCAATVEDVVPPFLRNSGRGWVTAEYSMLPRATAQRTSREVSKGRQSGRTMEIQRLIGRSLRTVVDMDALGERTITLDCDVIQADGGTRTASITGAYVALVDAFAAMRRNKQINKNPLHGHVASVSVGIYQGEAVLDLDYAEDSNAETDMNIVMNDAGAFIELQGTAEGHAFRFEELQSMIELARHGITQLIAKQQAALKE